MSLEVINIVLNLSMDGTVLSFSVQKVVSDEELTEVKSESNSPDVCPTCTCRISVFTRQFSPVIKLKKEDINEDVHDALDTKGAENASFDEDEKPIIELFVVNPYEMDPKPPLKQKKKSQKGRTCKKKRLETKKKSYKYVCEQCPEVGFELMTRYLLHHSKHGPVKCHKCKMELKDEESYRKHMETHTKTWNHRCKICNHCLMSEETLAAHIRWVHDKNHSCSFCGKVFTNCNYLLDHENRHKNIHPFQCKLCGASYTRKYSLLSHMEIHQGIEYICHFCQKSYRDKRYLRRHLFGHHIDPRESLAVRTALRCLHCYKVFQNEYLLIQHQKNAEIVGGPSEPVPDAVKCTKHCNRCFANEDELQMHLEMTWKNTNVYKYECEQCPGVGFRLITKYLQHLSKHGPVKCHKCKMELKDEESYTKHWETHAKIWTHRCEICNKRLLSEETHAAHVRWVHDKNHSCSFCGKVFTHWKYLSEHENKHKNIALYQCDLCGASFSQKINFLNHMETHEGVEYICYFCEKVYKNKYYLKHHIYGSHIEKEKYFECEKCKKQFTNVYLYKLHLKRHAEKTFPCPKCGKLFKAKIDVKLHINCVHTELSSRPKFECETCGKILLSKIALSNHMNSHKEVTEFTCRHCPKNFNSLTTLKRHEMIHTGEKPFTCQTCGKSFRHSDTLKTHIRLHTGEKPYECPLEECKKRFSDRGCFRSHLVVHEKQLNIKLIKKQNYLNDI